MSHDSQPEATMKGVVNVKYTADFKNAFSFEEQLPRPTIAKSEKKILVRNICVAGNPIDYKIAEGRLEKVLKRPLPAVVGCDFAGIVEYIPDWVKTTFKVGDRVCGFMLSSNHKTDGSFSEFCAPLEIECVKIPNAMSFEEAAGACLVGATSHQCLTLKGGISPTSKKGQKILILGGSTATGMAAIQLAKEFGCGEIAVTSSSIELCTELGATKVINYKEGEEWFKVLAGANFDMVYDCMGGPTAFTNSKAVLKKGGKFVTIAGEHPERQVTIGSVLGTAAKTVWRGCTSAFSGPSFFWFIALNPSRDVSLTYLMALYEAGKYKVLLDKKEASPYEFCAEGAVALYEQQRSGTSKGKLIMKIADT